VQFGFFHQCLELEEGLLQHWVIFLAMEPLLRSIMAVQNQNLLTLALIALGLPCDCPATALLTDTLTKHPHHLQLQLLKARLDLVATPVSEQKA
jgi:hypothetical protein